MRKQFLLLLLMTLLPLAGWAETKPVVSGLSAATGLKYTGNPQALLTGTVVYPEAYDYDNYSVQYVVKATHEDPTADEIDAATSVIPTRTDAQLYWIYYRLPADGGVYDADGDWQSVAVRINKAETAYTTAIAGEQDLVYSGAAQPLIATQAVSSFGTVLYNVDGGDYSEDVPEATAAGDHVVRYKVLGTANWKAIDEATVTVNIAPFNVVGKVEINGVNESYTYTGSQQVIAPTVTAIAGHTVPDFTDANYDLTTGTNTNVADNATDGNYVQFAFKNNFTGTIKQTFQIQPLSIVVTEGETAGQLAENFSLDEDDKTAANASVYGGTAKTPEVKLKWSGNALDYTDDYTRAYSDNVDASEAAKITFTGTGNFTGEFVMNFTIAPKPVTVKAKNFTKTYGEDDPTSEALATGNYFEIDGLAGEETVESAGVTGAPTFAIAEHAENVGTYNNVISIATTGTLAASNYTFAVADPDEANLIIEADPDNILKLQVKTDLAADKKTKVYDGTTDVAVAFTADDFEYVSGLLGNDTWEALSANATIASLLTGSDVAEGIQVGFTITVDNPNYASVQVDPMDYTITKREITVKTLDQAIDLTTDPVGEFESTPIVGTTIAITAGTLAAGDDIDDVITELEADTHVGPNGNVITIVLAGNGNYAVTEDTENAGKATYTGVNAIALGEGEDDLQLISDYAGQEVNVTINFAGTRNGRNLGGAERNWEKENWVTLTLPFDISVADLSSKLGYAIVNVIDPTQTVVNGTGSKFYGKLTMKGGNGYHAGQADENTKLAANKPILVKIADNIADRDNGVVDFGTQTIVAPEDLTVDAGKGALFVGTYKPKAVSSADNENIWFRIGGDYTKWAYIKSDSEAEWTIAPFEAYINVSGLPEGAAHNMTFYFEELDGSTTAIKSIDVDNIGAKQSAEGMYNLNGMKMNSVPTQKGVYIQNGKKIVIK